MPTNATAISRLKDYKYRVEINGLDCAMIQSFDPGDRTHGKSEHASCGMNFTVKEVGMIRFGDCTMTTVVPLEGDGKFYWEEWMNQGQDPSTGNGRLAKHYMRNFSV